MGMFDFIKAHPSLIPAWSPVISKKEYATEVRLITADGSAQIKDFGCTLDQYEIAADGRLLVTSENYRDYLHGEGLAQFLSESSAVDGAPGTRWMQGISCTLIPERRLAFKITHGRLVTAEITPQQTPWPLSARERRRRKAEKLAKRHGAASRKGRKWARVARGRRVPCLVLDEAFKYLEPHADALRKTLASMRHCAIEPMVVHQ